MRNWTAAASLFLFLLPLASAQLTPNIWKKYIGEPVPAGTPDLIDYSYAGYKNGEEAIPDDFALPVFNVTDYGATPDDGESDTQAIRDTIDAAKGGGIVFFPPGQYDVLTSTDRNFNRIIIPRSNIILRGSGAEGAIKGGTTIKMHNDVLHDRWEVTLFRTQGLSVGSSSSTFIEGSFPKGTKYFDVEDVSDLNNPKFITIVANGLFGDDWDQHSSVSEDDMPGRFRIKDSGVSIKETHEVDRVEGNRIYVKAPVLTHLNSSFKVSLRKLNIGIGFEDLHIDGNMKENYGHNVHNSRGGIQLLYTAHSWIRRCRFSNTTTAIMFANNYCNSAISNVIDGNSGHYPAVVLGSTYGFVGLLEDYTNNGMFHGVSIAGRTVGSVFWRIGGTSMGGPDGHGDQPRYTLFDNYSSVDHDRSSGTFTRLPHHLDGYVRWNNTVNSSRTFDLWTWGEAGKRVTVTQGILIGYKTLGGSIPRDAYVEGFGTHVSPDSLYEAQLQRRLGTLPAWVDASKDMHSEFIDPPERTCSIGLSGIGDLTNQTQDASAGVTYYFTVTNTGNRYDTIKLTTSGDATGTLSQTSVLLAPRASLDETLTIPGTQLTVSGEYVVKVTAASTCDNTQTAIINTTTTIYPKSRVLSNFPNPCNPETWIPYQLGTPSDVKITIYAMSGEVVRTLALGHKLSGSYQTKGQAAYWDGTNEHGETTASGVYFYKFAADDFSAVRKMLVLK